MPGLLLVTTNAAADPPESHPLRGMPATYEMWREERDLVRERLREAKRREEAAEDLGDSEAEARAEREVEAAEEALEEFRDRTTSRNTPMLVGGIVLTAAGGIGLGAGVFALTLFSQQQRTDGSGGTSTAAWVAWGVPTVGAIATGITFMTVGGPKRWRGADPVEPTVGVGVGPGSVAVSGTF